MLLTTAHCQAVEALSKQHLSELDRGLRQALDSRALSLASAAASAAASSSSSSGPGSGPGAARGLTAPAPGGTAGWQVRRQQQHMRANVWDRSVLTLLAAVVVIAVAICLCIADR
jgi:hypothetical protein